MLWKLRRFLRERVKKCRDIGRKNHSQNLTIDVSLPSWSTCNDWSEAKEINI